MDYQVQPMLYHLKLLQLLANLTLGANFICEGRLQRLLPIEHLLLALRDPCTRLPIKSKLLRVCTQVSILMLSSLAWFE